jgi:histone deacetylase 1/2
VPAAPHALSAVRASSSQWHSRLGHPATPIIRHVLRHHDLPLVSSIRNLQFMMPVSKGRVISYLFSVSNYVAKTPLEVIYSDVWGHAQTLVSGHNYYVSYIDAYSHFTWIYLLKRKSDVFDIFLQFQSHV